MNGELAQIIAIVAYGNLFLNGKEIHLSTNSSFQYVSKIKFARYKSKQDASGIEVANNIIGWLGYLRSVKVTRLWNVAFAWDRSDLQKYVADAFAGAVPRAIQADLSDYYELWYPKWEFDGQQSKSWSVEYRSLVFPQSHIYPAPDLGIVKEKVRQAVLHAKSFSERQDVAGEKWSEWFAKSLALLDSPNPIIPFHPDIIPDIGYSLVSRQIIASATQAYVFGGMGSWNDMGFESMDLQKEYTSITKELYEAVKLSLVIATNSFSL